MCTLKFGIRIVPVLNQLLSPADAFGGQGRGYSSYGTRGYKDPGKPKSFVGNSAGLPSQNTTRKGLGISAWGIVIVIVALILAGMGFYYFSICYNVCQPSKNKYDKMGMPTMA